MGQARLSHLQVPCLLGDALQRKASCTACGVLAEAWAFEGFQTSFAHGYSPLSTLQQNQAYTRTKRFVKYLNRASMKQSMNRPGSSC